MRPAGRLISYDERVVPFDLAVVIPLHGGAAYVEHSPGLGDELGFIPVDPSTLQATGEAQCVCPGRRDRRADVQGGFRRPLRGRRPGRQCPPVPGRAGSLATAFDGHTNCFIETGFGKALLIDFNYDTEPLTGHYPTRLGLPLLRQSRLNHLGKLAFQQFYWHSLLPGRDIPGISSAMPARGKTHPRDQATTSHR